MDLSTMSRERIVLAATNPLGVRACHCALLEVLLSLLVTCISNAAWVATLSDRLRVNLAEDLYQFARLLGFRFFLNDICIFIHSALRS